MMRMQAHASGNIDDPVPAEKLPSSVLTLVRPIGDKFPPGFEARAKAEKSPISPVKAERVLLNTLLGGFQPPPTDTDLKCIFTDMTPMSSLATTSLDLLLKPFFTA